MAVIQKNYYIPDDLYTGVLTGIYKITDGVVRHATGSKKGQIVKHLKQIDIPADEASKGILQAGIEIVKQNKKATALAGTVVLAGAVGAVAVHKIKNREPKVLKEFRMALRKYIDAIRNGELNIELIEDMMSALQLLREDKNYSKYYIQLSAEEIGILVGKIRDYTIDLAKDNDMEFIAEEKDDSEDMVLNFNNYLEIQKRIFEKAA